MRINGDDDIYFLIFHTGFESIKNIDNERTFTYFGVLIPLPSSLAFYFCHHDSFLIHILFILRRQPFPKAPLAHMIVSECKYTSDSYFGYSTELKKKFTYIHLVSIFQQQGPPISRNCKNWKNSITGGQVHYGGRCAFLHYPPYHRQGMSVNSLPRIPDIPLLLGYLIVKGDNGAPIMKKTI